MFYIFPYVLERKSLPSTGAELICFGAHVTQDIFSSVGTQSTIDLLQVAVISGISKSSILLVIHIQPSLPESAEFLHLHNYFERINNNRFNYMNGSRKNVSC